MNEKEKQIPTVVTFDPMGNNFVWVYHYISEGVCFEMMMSSFIGTLKVVPKVSCLLQSFNSIEDERHSLP